MPLERVRVDLGDSDHPESAGSGGSFGASNSTTATHRACMKLQSLLITRGKDGMKTGEPVEHADWCLSLTWSQGYTNWVWV